LTKQTKGTSRKSWKFPAMIVILGILSVGVLLLVEPIIAQLGQALFVDRRMFLGLPNFADVASNLGFVLVGGFGVWLCLGRSGKQIFLQQSDMLP
jgi:hypothetical protein